MPTAISHRNVMRFSSSQRTGPEHRRRQAVGPRRQATDDSPNLLQFTRRKVPTVGRRRPTGERGRRRRTKFVAPRDVESSQVAAGRRAGRAASQAVSLGKKTSFHFYPIIAN